MPLFSVYLLYLRAYVFLFSCELCNTLSSPLWHTLTSYPNRLIADFEKRIAQYEEQKNLAVLAVKEQRGSDLREMSELESRIEELQLALDLESTKTQGVEIVLGGCH